MRVNKAFTSITGYHLEDVLGKGLDTLNSSRQNEGFYKNLWESVSKNGYWRGELWSRRKIGDVYAQHLTVSTVKDELKQTVNYVLIFSDVTDVKLATEEIQRLAFFDPLTNLPNRRLLSERTAHAIFNSDRSGFYCAVLYLDLDHFKNLNDTLGHEVGDLLLQHVAVRLTTSVRQGDTVARMGGDEFVVLLEGLSEKAIDAATQAEAVGKKILQTINQPYKLNSHQYNISVSLGIAMFVDHQYSVEVLLQQADIAMYQAKKFGRSTFRFFNQDMQDILKSNALIRNDLLQALKKNQLQLYYQVQVDDCGQPVGAEALIRWVHPERGIILPMDFIPLAEENGLILKIGSWVIDTACKQLSIWQKSEITSNLSVSINVSAKQFQQSDFSEQIQSAIMRHATNPNLLKLELTESILLFNISEIVEIMNVLNKIGVRFSLDDFGTGYSSLKHLKELPLHQLKIDQSFVRHITTESTDLAIVQTTIVMANILNLDSIAEGVETDAQWNILKENGCKSFQGYFFGNPEPVDEFVSHLKQDKLG